MLTLLAGTGIILGAAYMLKLYRKSFFGKITKKENKTLKDLNFRESAALIPLVLLIIFLGIYPKPILSPIENSVKNTISLVQAKATKLETIEFITNVNKGAK